MHLGLLSPLHSPIYSYPMYPFTLPQPLDLQCLFLCGSIRTMQQTR